MRNRQIQLLYGIGVMQILGTACYMLGKQAGGILIIGGTILLIGYATGLLVKEEKEMVCPECQTLIPKKSRICPECGYRYREGIPENKLTEYIEQEKEAAMTSEKIDHDFEKIESIVVDEMAAYDGDIEDFLENRSREEEV